MSSSWLCAREVLLRSHFPLPGLQELAFCRALDPCRHYVLAGCLCNSVSTPLNKPLTMKAIVNLKMLIVFLQNQPILRKYRKNRVRSNLPINNRLHIWITVQNFLKNDNFVRENLDKRILCGIFLRLCPPTEKQVGSNRG